MSVTGLAELVERFTTKREVAGSIPGAGPIPMVLQKLRNEDTVFPLQTLHLDVARMNRLKWQSRLQYET